MTGQYEPEIGQAIFGQPWQNFAVSELGIAALAAISYELETVMWNIEQREYESPFSNTGNRFMLIRLTHTPTRDS